MRVVVWEHMKSTVVPIGGTTAISTPIINPIRRGINCKAGTQYRGIFAEGASTVLKVLPYANLVDVVITSTITPFGLTRTFGASPYTSIYAPATVDVTAMLLANGGVLNFPLLEYGPFSQVITIENISAGTLSLGLQLLVFSENADYAPIASEGTSHTGTQLSSGSRLNRLLDETLSGHNDKLAEQIAADCSCTEPEQVESDESIDVMDIPVEWEMSN